MSDAEFPTPNPRLDLQRPDPQNRNSVAVDRLFDAVTCLLVERGAELLGEALKPEAVTARAGKARASYYRTHAQAEIDLVLVTRPRAQPSGTRACPPERAGRTAYTLNLGPLHLTVSQLTADGLLAVFFFVAGLELKHELVLGSLSNAREAVVPVAAAIGGMIVPALIFVAVNSVASAVLQSADIEPTLDLDSVRTLLVILNYRGGLPAPSETP